MNERTQSERWYDALNRLDERVTDHFLHLFLRAETPKEALWLVRGAAGDVLDRTGRASPHMTEEELGKVAQVLEILEGLLWEMEIRIAGDDDDEEEMERQREEEEELR